MFAAAGAVASAVALPANPAPRATCTNPEKRLEWREMKPEQQQSYLEAVKCLTTKPSKIRLNSTLYDDFPYVHFHLNSFIHGGAPFLPWHRYFSWVYLNTLREECAYDGPGTYWDWTQDTKGLRLSAVMAPEHGFGGDGSQTRTEIGPDGSKLQCVSDGPFANLRPEWLCTSPWEIVGGGHCFFRNLPEVSEPDAFARMATTIEPESIAILQQIDNWADFKRDLEGGPHGTIHASLGGEMNPTTSPNEPLFFLHHPQIDRIWWQWQQMNPDKRLSEYNGPASHYGEGAAREVSLDDKLPMLGLAEELTVREVMDASGRLCYSY